MRFRNLSVLAIVVVVSAVAGARSVLTSSVPQAPSAADGWIVLFDGRTLDGWAPSGSGAPASIRDGILPLGPGRTVTYTGKDGAAAYDNVEVSAEVRTAPGGRAVVAWTARPGTNGAAAPRFEVLLQNGGEGVARTGSLVGVRGVYKTLVADGQWLTVTVTVQKPRLQVRVNGTLVVDYHEPVAFPADAPAPPRMGRGTVALAGQAGDVQFCNIRARPLPAATDMTPAPPPDGAAMQILRLTRAGFPVIDLHAHLKGGLTLDDVLGLSRRTGMALGVAVNCGKGFPIETDAGAEAFLAGMKGQPVFIAMQAEGREWVTMFSKETRAKFDYVFTDGMTWTNPAGKRMRLWMPDEVEIGPDEQAFMDLLVSKIAGILESEPIDIYVNPTFLPAVIAARYDALWTDARMQRVIDAAVRNRVAIEINARYKIPSERFLRLAKAAGATFTFGTNNAGAGDLGDWSYPLEMQTRLGLTAADMFVPGRQPSRAHRQ